MSSKKSSGPVIGSTTAPLISAVGTDRVIFSKKLLMIIGGIIIVATFIFFSVEQSRIAGNLARSRAALNQNNNIKTANERLESAGKDLREEEDALVNMYSKWLDEDNAELDMSQEQLDDLKKQFIAVKSALDSNKQSISDKELTLVEKEKRLKSYQFKVQQKQGFLDQMAVILSKLNMTVPKGIEMGADPDDEFIWDDIVEEQDDDYYTEYYTGDDDWMSDEEWY